MKRFDDGSDRFRLMIWSIVDEWVDMLMMIDCWWYCWLMIMSDPVDDGRLLMMCSWMNRYMFVNEWIDMLMMIDDDRDDDPVDRLMMIELLIDICSLMTADWWGSIDDEWVDMLMIVELMFVVDDVRFMMMIDWYMLFVMMNESVCWWYCWLMIMSDPVNDVHWRWMNRYVDNEWIDMLIMNESICWWCCCWWSCWWW